MRNGPSLRGVGGAGVGPAESRARRPCIGICAARERARWSFWEQDAVLVAGTYVDAAARAGGLPLGLVSEEGLTPLEAGTLVDRIEGLLLIGGADVDPGSYGASHTPRTERTVQMRDRFELALVREALARDIPVLGICRGLQILNVATGGTLYQHLADEGFGEHRPAPGRLDRATAHRVEVTPGTLAAGAGSLRGTVNSHHHQGIARIGDGGCVTVRSLDGAIEAMEWPSYRYALGVQWHPEALERSTTIADFVDAAALSATVGAQL